MQDYKNNQTMEPGAIFMEYVIEEVLGAGNFGVVYKAANRYLDETVAIKEFFPRQLAYRAADFQIVPKSPQDEKPFNWSLNRFLKEARILWDLSQPVPYPGIIQVKGYREDNGTAYMIMEYAEGLPLSDLIKNEQRLSREQLERIIEPLLVGLEKIHNASILHRDIKPSNLLIRPDGSPVLIDFGAAKPDIDQQNSKSTMLVYTPMYAPPEQITAEGQLGAWTDIYSLGATLYHAVIGHPPTNPISRIQGSEHVSAVEGAAGLYPKYLLAAIDAAIEPIFKNRPQTIAKLREMIYPPNAQGSDDATLLTLSEKSPVEAETTLSTANLDPSTPPESPNGTLSGHGAGQAAVALITLVSIIGLVYYTGLDQSKIPNSTPSPIPPRGFRWIHLTYRTT